MIDEVHGVARVIRDAPPGRDRHRHRKPQPGHDGTSFPADPHGRPPDPMFVDRSDTASIEAAVEAGVSAYIVDGLKKERVKPILDMAVSRFKPSAGFSANWRKPNPHSKRQARRARPKASS